MSWFSKLKQGLSKSSARMAEGISSIITKRPLDDATIEELEEWLIASDVGVNTAARMAEDFGRKRFGKEVSDDEVRSALAENIAEILKPVATPLVIDATHTPFVILVVGVNGNGKTTTIGKLAQQYREQGKRVMLAACDTFRAAAVEQLTVWGERTGCSVIRGEEGADPASVAFTAMEQAQKQQVDVLMIDTAGRLHNKKDLMDELAKIRRIIVRSDDTAPHATLLVLDATTGQNAHAQVEAFQQLVQITGLIITKLDGTAKGGVVVALAESFKLPIHAIGVGEAADDLRPFDAEDFARSLMGVEAA